MIGNLNVLINLFDKIFINPAKQIKRIFFSFKIFKIFFSAIILFL